jgi:putative DNA primase/helicase
LPVIRGYHPRPTAIVRSGNGINALWRLAEPVKLNGPESYVAIESRNMALAKALGAQPGTHNIDRILRVPGTINFPNEAKRKKGRTVGFAEVLEFNELAYLLTDFPLPKSNESETKKTTATGPRRKPKLKPAVASLLYIEGSGDYPSRSELLFAFIRLALDSAVDENDIVNAVLDPQLEGKGIYEHVEEKGGEAYIKKQIANAINKGNVPADEKNRMTIRIEDGKLDEAWRATEQALFNAKCPVYVRGGKLVWPQWRWERVTIDDDREVLTAAFEQYNMTQLADMMQHHAAIFIRYDKKQKCLRRIDPPDRLVQRLLEAGHWAFPSAVGIINSPTMRPDGSILAEPGYDAKTKLWYKPSSGVGLPPISDEPSRQEAEVGLRLINELLDEFPFKGEDREQRTSVSRSVALAAIMTTVIRACFRVCPIFGFIAPEPRTGKTYLVRLIAAVSTGHEPVHTAGSQKYEEMEKRIETAALLGRQILSLNNLPNGMLLESEALAQLSSEAVMNIRKLGRHEEGVCDCSATTVLMNGNNISIRADLVPRTPICHLDAKMERPETRSFKDDPTERVRGDRGAYLAAVFTIVRAFRTAGSPRPKEMHAVAGYDDWSKCVQQPLIWLGMEDPLAGIDDSRIAAEDDNLVQLLEVLKTHLQPDQVFAVADCRTLAEEMWLDAHTGRPVYRRPDLRELMTIRGTINTKSFGRLVARNNNRVRDGWVIRRVSNKEAKVVLYRLCQE